MAPSSKSGKHDNKQKQRKQDSHVVKLLNRGKLSGQLSQRWFLKRRPRVRVPLKTIVSEATLRAGHIFLGFTKCGRYVLSYTRDYGEEDDTYTYHLYWWEFNLHRSLKQVQCIRLFADETIYSDLYLAVCEWHNAQSKMVIFGFNMCSSSSALLNMVMSDENNRDIYITIISMPAIRPPCTPCPPSSSATATATATDTGADGAGQGFVLNARYQVVHPFPTFQPALQLKKEQVILLNTSYFLVACAISQCPGEQAGEAEQILYKRRPSSSSTAPSTSTSTPTFSTSQGSPERDQEPSRPAPTPRSPNQSQAAIRAREFAADIFRRAQATTSNTDSSAARPQKRDGQEKSKEPEEERRSTALSQTSRTDGEREGRDGEREGRDGERGGTQTSELEEERQGGSQLQQPPSSSKQNWCAKQETKEALADSPSPQAEPQAEPGYVNYTRLKYRLHPQGTRTQQDGDGEEDQDDKVQLPFTVSDLKGNNLQLVTGPCDGQCVCVEQLTLDFEYVINEVIRNDAEWGSRFCSFSDYDVVILEMCPETNIVVINIGLMLLAFPPSEEKLLRPESFHTSLQVSWDLNTGLCSTVGVGELKEMKGQTSGSVWSGYRKSCVDTVMRWLVPESSSRHINRMTNEALHKGMPLQVLSDSDGGTWITR